ncbi:hypothetical protein ACQ4PT_062459 [Festuca glaucescens]
MAAAAVGGAIPVVPPMPPQPEEKAGQQPLMAVVAPMLPQPEGEQPPVAVAVDAILAPTPPQPEEKEGEQPLVAADAVVAPTPPRAEVKQPPMAVDAVVAPLPPQPRAEEEGEQRQPPEATDAVSEAISFVAPTSPTMPPPPPPPQQQQQEAEDEQPAPAAAPPQPLESRLGTGPVEEGYNETLQDENPLQVQGSADEGGKETRQDENPLHVTGPADEGDKGTSSQDKDHLQAPGPADKGDKVTLQDENPLDDSLDDKRVYARTPCCFRNRIREKKDYPVLHCPECNHCSDRLESFLDLSLEINQMDTLLDSLESFTKTEVVESFTCDGCKTRVNMEKHLKVEQAPEVLVIQLKRFENLGSNISKIQEMVKYQLELDLKPFMSSADTNPQKYDLYGVVEHLGESSKGHYVCYIRSSETDWYLFNDEKVMKLSEDKVLDSKAYLLFYVKQGSSPWFSTLLEEKNTLLLGYLQELAEKGLNEDGVSIDSDKGSYSRSGSGSDSDEQDLPEAEMLYRRSLGGGLSGETQRPTSPPRSSLENGNVRRMALLSKNNENVSLQGSRGKEMSHSTHGLPSHVNGAGSRGGSSRENGESCSLLQSSSHKPEEDCCPENLTLHKDDEMRGSCVSPAGEVRAHYGVETRARKRMRQQSTAGTTAKRRKGGGLKKALRKKSVGRAARGRCKKRRR